MTPYREDKATRSYINGRNAARDGLTIKDMPEGLDDLEKVNWECGFTDFLVEMLRENSTSGEISK